MQPIKVAQRYFDAWNKRDADAIVSMFAQGGTYSDPTAGDGLAGQAVAAYARRLWETFPDLWFDLVAVGQSEGNVVTAEWVMHGTNTGSLEGLPPTGRSLALRGADFIQVEGELIKSVRGYFDSRAVSAQLGLNLIVQPNSLGPFTFGTSVSVQSGKRTKPGAFSITALETRSKKEMLQVAELSQEIATEMADMPGFIGWTAATLGPRMVTITAWEHPHDPQTLAQTATHRRAMEKFLGKEIGAGGVTSVWIPEHINPIWMRCRSCERMLNYEHSRGKCECGERLPDPLPYW